jgi:23S rRNA (guanosine2251-2'-O)-methyltransferase
MARKLRNEELNRLTPDTYRTAEKIPLTVVLDNVRSLHNVGSVFRTCDAFRVDQVILCGLTATPPDREIEKTALGATKSVKWEHYPTTLAAIEKLKADGYKCVAVEQAELSISPDNFEYNGERVAIVFGNEVYGIDQEVIDACEVVIEIPQFGSKHSLNIAVSVGIVLWEFVRGQKPSGL